MSEVSSRDIHTNTQADQRDKERDQSKQKRSSIRNTWKRNVFFQNKISDPIIIYKLRHDTLVGSPGRNMGDGWLKVTLGHVFANLEYTCTPCLLPIICSATSTVLAEYMIWKWGAVVGGITRGPFAFALVEVLRGQDTNAIF